MTHPSAETPEEAKLNLAAGILLSGGKIHMRALGASMIPALWPGDLLAIESASTTNLSPGEIVLVHRDGRFFIHRLIQCGSPSGAPDWVTRGDALPHPDPPVAAPNMIGRVCGIVRQNGMLVPTRIPSWGAQVFSRMLRHSNLLRDLALRCRLLRRKLSIISSDRSPNSAYSHFPAVANFPGE